MATGGAERLEQKNITSDVELLHAIQRDLRVVYDEILKKPLPQDILSVLFRIDTEECMQLDRDRKVSVC